MAGRARYRSGVALVAVVCLWATAPVFATTTSVLAQRPFAPKNVGLFSPQTYPAAPPLVPADPANELDDAGARAALQNYLALEFPTNPTSQTQALAVYDAASSKAIVPEPPLRAAMAALKGTIAAPAINVLRSGLYKQVIFGTPASPGAEAEVELLPGDSKPSIIVASQFRGENPFLFTSILAHEALHQDTVDSSTEELINASFDSLVYLHQLLKHPSLATLGTELARRLNTKLMARINSGAGSELGLTDANTDNVYPGGTPMAKFEQPFLPLGSNDPGNAYLDKLAAAIHQTGRPVCTGLGFSSAMVDCIDANGNDHVAPSQIIKVAKTLQLRVPAS